VIAPRARVVFFDIGGTLGAPVLSARMTLERLDVYPYVPAVLEALGASGVALGIVSHIGEVTPEAVTAVRAALARADLERFFRDDLLVFGKKDDVAIFHDAASTAGAAPDLCVFVGENAGERVVASRAGMRVAPHPLLARAVVDGESLHYVRIAIPVGVTDAAWRAALLEQPLVPLHVSDDGGRVVHAVVARSGLARVMNMQLVVQTIGAPGLPATTDLYLVRDDLAARTGRLTEEGQAASLLDDPRRAPWVLSASFDCLYVALPGDESIDDLHFRVARHGHHVRLSPDVAVLQPFDAGARARVAAASTALLAERDLSAAELAALDAVTADRIGAHLDRYTGAAPLGDAGASAITTRHSVSAGNARAARQLVRDLERIGGDDFTVRRHPFVLSGREVFNVEAEWPGTAPGIVVVSAHLDSTAAQSHFGPGVPPYRPALDPAPGADDDGSGVAAVLVIAETLKAMAAGGRPRHGIRFVLFNGEEQGLVGSRAWVRDQALAARPIVAAFQMDMIGNNQVPPPLFEVHAGYSIVPEVEERSLLLARRVQRLQPGVAPALAPPELSFTKGPWPEDRDGAEGRSDHSSFHARGYAACCVSEDLFANDPGQPAAEVNANYHKATDTAVNRAYAADIARVVAAAAWITANP
jgi:hypothetical protein